MEMWIKHFKNFETNDFDPEILAKLNSFLKVMIRYRIEFNAQEIADIGTGFKSCLSETVTFMPRAKAILDLISPCPRWTWDPIPLLRILAKSDPGLRYLRLVPSKLTYGHHGLYIKFRDHYIILVTNHPTPLIYTQNVLSPSPDLRRQIETLGQLWNHHQSTIQMGISLGGYSGQFDQIILAYSTLLPFILHDDGAMLSVPEGPPPRPRYVEE